MKLSPLGRQINQGDFYDISCRLFRDGYPAEYLLQSDVKSSSRKKLRWFSIGQRNEGATKPHKVVVLMGATGAGKSTLINGMAN